MPILNIIPADQVLAIAIKDATKSTSTVNPARITTAVQKMRPDWSVNKRRVKRLLRSMNNDAWKAAVLPSSTSSSSGPTTIPTTTSLPLAPDNNTTLTSATASSTTLTPSATQETPTSSSSGGRRPGRAARNAAARRAKNASLGSTPFPTAGSKESGNSGNICDTAPASPGSPAAAAVAAGFSATRIGHPDCSSTPLPGTTVVDVPLDNDILGATPTTPQASAVVPTGNSPPPDATTAAARWDETMAGEFGGAHGVSGDTSDELSDSLRLEPDIELEPGVDLKADLGLAAAEDSVMAISAAAGQGEGQVVAEIEDVALTIATTIATMAVAVGDAEDASGVSSSGRADDLGFEMIEKAEAAGAAVNAEGAPAAAERAPVGSGPVPGKAGRKAWPWMWGRN